MATIWNWIQNEWSDPATHAWLVGAMGSFLAYDAGKISEPALIVALVSSALGIIIPTQGK